MDAQDVLWTAELDALAIPGVATARALAAFVSAPLTIAPLPDDSLLAGGCLSSRHRTTFPTPSTRER